MTTTTTEGRRPNRSPQGGIKLTEKTATAARILHNNGFPRADIAEALNISMSTVWWLLYGDRVLTPTALGVPLLEPPAHALETP